MRRMARFALCCVIVLLAAGVVLAVDACSKCGEKIESQRWNFCPYCGQKLDKGAGAQPATGQPPQGVSSTRDMYEPVIWDKIVFEKDKYHDHKVRFSARFTGIQQYFAPVEVLGITKANFVNFSIQGNRTNYVDRKNIQLVEKLNRLRPFTTIVIYATIKVRKDVYARGQDVYIVILEDLDVE